MAFGQLSLCNTLYSSVLGNIETKKTNILNAQSKLSKYGEKCKFMLVIEQCLCCYSMEAGGMTPGKDLDKSLSGEQK